MKEFKPFMKLIREYLEDTQPTNEELTALEDFDNYVFIKTIVEPSINTAITKANNPSYVKKFEEYHELNGKWVAQEKKKEGLAKRRAWLKNNYKKKNTRLSKDLNKSK